MKAINSIFILSLSLMVFACGKHGDGKSLNADVPNQEGSPGVPKLDIPNVEVQPPPVKTPETSAPPAKNPKPAPATAAPTTPPPAPTNSPATGPVTQAPGNHVVQNPSQIFRLNQLNQMLGQEITCKVQLKSVMPNTAVQLIDGDMKITFSPEFIITMNGKEFAGAKTLCGEDATNGLVTKSEGGLFKDEQKNTFELTYMMNVADPVTLKMEWDASGTKRGKLFCKRATQKNPLMRGTLETCTISENTEVK